MSRKGSPQSQRETADGTIRRDAGQPFTVVEAHVDWLTATSQGAARRPLFDQLGRQLLDHLEAGGDARRQWHWQGFHGERCGQFSWGSRPDCSVVTMSATVSARYWRRFWPLSTNISRLDLAVSVEGADDADLVSRSWRQYLEWRRTNPNSASWSLITNSDGGSTFYLGRRSSDWFCRIYRKDKESPTEYQRPTWRYELELKRRPAIEAARWLAGVPHTERSIVATVGDYLRRRGIDRPWDDVPGAFVVTLPRERTDTQRRLDWFRTQVAPAVAEVLLSVDRAEVLLALGLDEEAEHTK